MNKFERGKIYTIRSHKTPLIYVGSTTDKYLSNRMANHRYSYKLYKNGKYNYVASFDILELDRDCYIELYEYYPCESQLELRRREGEVIRLLDCVNKCIAGRTKKDYNVQYYVNNKDKFTQKHNCECGGKYTYQNKARHMKSKKHRDYIEFITD